MLITHADPHGRGDADPFGIKLRIVPAFKEGVEDISNSLEELNQCGLIITYSMNGSHYYTIKQWDRFQQFNAKNRGIASRFPDPPEVTVSHSESQTITDDHRQELEVELELEKELEYNKYIATTHVKRTCRRLPIYEITFNWTTFKLEGITENHIKKWQEAFPAVDIPNEIKRAELWQESRPDKRKKNYKAFLTKWFSRSQEKGGSQGFGTSNEDHEYQEALRKAREKDNAEANKNK